MRASRRVPFAAVAASSTSSKKKNRVVEFIAAPVRVLHLSREETCAKSVDKGPDLIIIEVFCNAADVTETEAKEASLCDSFLQTRITVP